MAVGGDSGLRTGAWAEDNYREFFRHLNGFDPYPFQIDVARRLSQRQNLVLRAPTGSGKTLTVLTPFLYDEWEPRPTRLIYAVPLRTLAQGIAAEARRVVARLGGNVHMIALNTGDQTGDPPALGTRCCSTTPVTVQSGDQPDDPFLTQGRIIVTTYDQVLSGFLSAPYGLSPRLHNVNSAAIAGALVIFDEFHLMEPRRAFLTGAAGLRLFRELTQSVWMTATATSPLVTTLGEALGAHDASPSEAEMRDFPTVKSITRHLRYADEALTPSEVLRYSSGRTIVICNTVSRAQSMYLALQAVFERTGPNVPVLLLHAGFFKSHRDERVLQLLARFGKGAAGRAILVATQVIEAGVDISCDDLHTELCPMNALVQRAGRCARYPGEMGTVHLYRLPADDRSWLPYGSLSAPDDTMAATEDVLSHLGAASTVTPWTVASWVEKVHAADDGQALREGWRGRLGTCTQLIRQNSIEGHHTRVTDYIREESTDDVQVLIAPTHDLPERPSRCQSITVSRWQLVRLFEGTGMASPRMRIWVFGERTTLSRWEPVTGTDQLRRAQIVCLAPDLGGYTVDAGLILDGPGRDVSPPRDEPKRPGYNPLRAEHWAHHALAVQRETQSRAALDGVPGWLGEGFARRYGVAPSDVARVVSLAGLLHDLGKLQHSWQGWAEAWQRAKDPAYRHLAGLAHTDYDPDDLTDRARERGFQHQRPPHAVAGAYAAIALLPRLLPEGPAFKELASACLAAIGSHHGGWLSPAPDLGVAPLWPRWEQDVQAAGVADTDRHTMDALFRVPDRRTELNAVLETTTATDLIGNWWPLVAYLMRTVRLADQRATSEGTQGD